MLQWLRERFGLRKETAEGREPDAPSAPSLAWAPSPSLTQVQSGWLDGFLAAPGFYSNLGQEACQALARRFPERAQALLKDAEDVHAHSFRLLGSGWFQPVDPERSARAGYVPIDWALDPVSGLRFPMRVPHREWCLATMRPGNADIKLPWELGRCQHFIPLAQAWRMTRESRHALEILCQMADFMEANPVGLGVNWTCAMDVAIRCVNWVLCLDMVKDCPDIPRGDLAAALAALHDHGLFLRSNLEDGYEVTSNHYLSDIVGLHFLGALFGSLPSGREWATYSRKSIEREITVQILPDGADFESSVPYHRLVAELFLASFHLSALRGDAFPGSFAAALESALAFHSDVLRPDGLMPQVGDADDGRLHIFTDYGQRLSQDGRHLLGPAGALFKREEWLARGGEAGAWERCWWGLDAALPERRQEEAPVATPEGVLLPLSWVSNTARSFSSGADGLRVVTDESPWGYQVQTLPLAVPQDLDLLLTIRGESDGPISIGVLDKTGSTWLASQTLGPDGFERSLRLSPQCSDEVTLVLANADARRPVSARLAVAELRAVEPTATIPLGLGAESVRLRPVEDGAGAAVLRAFPDAGLWVARQPGRYLLIQNAPVGTGGFGNHKHNDLLSFEYHVDGEPFVVDPGSYVYSSDAESRNLFRSTCMHSTLCIDGEEQNEIRPDWLFRVFEQARPECLGFSAGPDALTFTGRHRGYKRLRHPVRHDRHFRLDLVSWRLSVADRLAGEGRHALAWNFSLAPDVRVELLEAGAAGLTVGERHCTFLWPRDMVPSVQQSWYSPSYGVRLPCLRLRFRLEAALGGADFYAFSLIPGDFEPAAARGLYAADAEEAMRRMEDGA